MRSLAAIPMAMVLSMVCVSQALAVVLVNNGTQGFYNDSLGTTLNGTNPAIDDGGIDTFLFPNINSDPNDPTFDSPSEPDLTAAAGILGDWLGDPANLNANWNGPQAIPSNWTVDDETAVVYAIDGGAGGLSNVLARFGIDNGIFVWLDGVYLGGQERPGGAVLGELEINIGNIAAGQHYLQILREDHGGGTGYSIEVTGDARAVPEPASLVLAGLGLSIVGLMKRKRP